MTPRLAKILDAYDSFNSPDQETMLKAGFVEDHPCL